MMKRLILLLIICLALTIAAVGCGQPTAQIAFFIYDENDTFLSELMQKIPATAPGGTPIEIRYAANSQVVQNQQIVSLAEAGIELFVINPVDRLACGAIAEKCVKSGIDVIFFNREPMEDALNAGNSFFVGTDASGEGRKQALMVAELFGSNFRKSPYDKNGDGRVQIVILKGEQGHQDAERRTESCIRQLWDLGYRVEILGVEVGNWSKASGYDAMKRLYENYGDQIELVFSNNDDMALGAIDYLVEAEVFFENIEEYDQPFVIVGVDGTSVGLSAIRRGLLYGTVQNDSESQADAVMALADYILEGKDMEDFPYEITNNRYIYVDGDVITLQNLIDHHR